MKLKSFILFQGPTALILLALACQPNKNKQEEIKEPTNHQTSISFINGNLDTLWVADTAFTKLGKNSSVYFSYFFSQSDTSLTLHGWKAKKNPKGYDFDPDPDIVLGIGPESQASFGTKFYFSPIYLTDKVLDTIKDSITISGYKYILFAPTIDSAKTAYGNLVKYKILLSKTRPFGTMMQADSAYSQTLMYYTDPNLDANPSPPKQNY